jgi:DNA-binding MarR family transcriptional regulator
MGALMRLATHRVRRQMVEAVRAAGFDDLQDAHLKVFQYPGPDDMRPSDLARQLQMTRQATNHLLAQLESLGYVERRAGQDQERRRIYLTDRGARLMATIRASVRRIESEWERAVGTTRFRTFIDVLRTMSNQRSGQRAAGQ